MNGILTFSFTKKSSEETLESRVARARDGDRTAREELIRDYAPFILKTASSLVKRYVAFGKDDEASIAMSAFNEAIDAYASKRPGFLAFAATVIRRRLVDHFRKAVRHPEIPFSALENRDSGNSRAVDIEVLDSYGTTDWQKVIERRDEIERWKETLEEFGLTLNKVVKMTPKHEDARTRAIEIAKIVAGNRHLRDKLFLTKRLPVDDILSWLPPENRVSRKTMDRQSVYITALVIILTGEFPSIREFLGIDGRGGDT
ncbi:MAG TPA: RNA polymerase sigma-I factor [Firmicutes bacterium]|nr:RNA polymerase sigma-I factor [Candidatus Fermentithermobacillaceae bacterium]